MALLAPPPLPVAPPLLALPPVNSAPQFAAAVPGGVAEVVALVGAEAEVVALVALVALVGAEAAVFLGTRAEMPQLAVLGTVAPLAAVPLPLAGGEEVRAGVLLQVAGQPAVIMCVCGCM